MSVKLTDAQLVMMSAAAQREDRCLAAPERMKGAVVSKAGAKPVKLGFAREIHAKPGTPLWRRDETGRSVALKLTAAGLKAIAVDERPQDAIEPGEASQPLLLDVGRHAPTAAPRDGSPQGTPAQAIARARPSRVKGSRSTPRRSPIGWVCRRARSCPRPAPRACPGGRAFARGRHRLTPIKLQQPRR